MPHRRDKRGSHEGRKKPAGALDRAMDLQWTESVVAGGAAPPAASNKADDIIDVVPAEAEVVQAVPQPDDLFEVVPPAPTNPAPVRSVDTTLTLDLGGPFIEAMLVESTSASDAGPFIEAVVVETAPVDVAVPTNVADWLSDVMPPSVGAPPPAPPLDATPDWLSELVDTEAAVRPKPPPNVGARPDWLDNLP